MRWEVLRDYSRSYTLLTSPTLPTSRSASAYKELMDYLSRDRHMAQMQLALLGEERNRLRTERDAADRAAAELRAQYNDVQNTMHRARQDLQVGVDQCVDA